jgi:hypothetical protein
VPESIRNAIVLAVIAVLVAVMGVGLLAWSRRPAQPRARPAAGLRLLVNDPEGGLYDVNIKLRQMERRLAESQVTIQKLTEQLEAGEKEREQLSSRQAGLEKEVRGLRKQLQESAKRPARTTTESEPTEGPAGAATGPTSPSGATGAIEETTEGQSPPP